ncbi:MAG: flavodoxin [Magnetovibrio sp.]|nr:flavodoxin [Magnetovibrio sp.]
MVAEKQKYLLIVAHAPSENTLLMRDRVVKGAATSNTDRVIVNCSSPFDATPIEVKQADGIILGTTENLGYMSGALKDFFDRVYYPCLDHTQGIPYVLYIRAGHDGTGTKRAVEKITTGLKWKVVNSPLICRGEWQDSFLTECEELGALMATGIDAGIF